MVRPTEIDIVKHVPLEDLEKTVREYERGRSTARVARMKERLIFIRMRYKGYSVEEAASNSGFTLVTGYAVQKLWNEGGMAALEPNFGGGRISKLTDEQRDELKDVLSITPMPTRDVHSYIKEEYGIDYTMKQVWEILTKMGLHHAKPYPRDYRRPDDAEDILKKTL
jgi:transposase